MGLIRPGPSRRRLERRWFLLVPFMLHPLMFALPKDSCLTPWLPAMSIYHDRMMQFTFCTMFSNCFLLYGPCYSGMLEHCRYIIIYIYICSENENANSKWMWGRIWENVATCFDTIRHIWSAVEIIEMACLLGILKVTNCIESTVLHSVHFVRNLHLVASGSNSFLG